MSCFQSDVFELQKSGSFRNSVYRAACSTVAQLCAVTQSNHLDESLESPSALEMEDNHLGQLFLQKVGSSKATC